MRQLKLFGFFLGNTLLTQEFGYDENHARRVLNHNLDSVPGIYYPRAPFEMRAYAAYAELREYPLHDPEGIERSLRQCVRELNEKRKAEPSPIGGNVVCILDL